MRILITGAAGMLGQDVAGAAELRGHEALSFPRAELDITNRELVDQQVARTRPDVVINCAAWTNVDGAESEPDATLAANGPGAGNVARAAAGCGAWTIHVSSDYVFDGTKREPYVESDRTSPASSYGRSKLAGEHAVSTQAPESHTTVRSSWLFGVSGPCFPATMLRLGAERAQLSVVDDQVGCPTFTGHLAEALLELAQARPLGIVHVAGGGFCSWFEFASAVISTAGLACEVAPCTTEQMPRPAPRPAYSVLGTERETDAPRLPSWRDGLAAYMSAQVSGP
jgi:dTDP-4-dehydrorhamnose reductase